jgi:predicted secreted protein
MMKSFLPLALLLILATCLMTGCGGDENGTSGVEPVETITTGVNQEFTITRQFDLNSGFIWRETYDEKMLELLENSIDTEKRDDTQIILLQVFRFKALKKGKTEVTIVHRRETLQGPIIAQQEVISVNIK